jgi:hypothetical protein
VCVGGRGPFDFIIDTGSSETLFTTQLARRLGLSEEGPAIRFGGAGCFGSTHAIRMPALSLGRHLVAAADGYTIRATGLGGPGQPQGVLGVNSLSKLGPLRLDFRRRMLSIGDGTSAQADPLAASGAADLPADWRSRRPRIRAPLAMIGRGDGVSLRVIVSLGSGAPQAWLPDTGAWTSLIDGEDAAASHLQRVPGIIPQPLACSSKKLRTHRVWSRSWRLADHPLRPQALQVIAVKDTVGVEGVLGAKTMAEYDSVIFDWGDRQLLLGVGG